MTCGGVLYKYNRFLGGIVSSLCPSCSLRCSCTSVGTMIGRVVVFLCSAVPVHWAFIWHRKSLNAPQYRVVIVGLFFQVLRFAFLPPSQNKSGCHQVACGAVSVSRRSCPLGASFVSTESKRPAFTVLSCVCPGQYAHILCIGMADCGK